MTRRRWLGATAVVVLIVMAALAYFGWRMIGVRADADAARVELRHALELLEAGDPKAAEEHVSAARQHVDAAQDRVGGIGGTVWSLVPIAGGGVDDVRHLVSALDAATDVLKAGVELHPLVLGKDASLVKGEKVNLKQLDTVLTLVEDGGARLREADRELDAVSGNTPYIGDAVAEARDEAATEIAPALRALDAAEPLLTALPDMLGANGDSRMQIMILNPAEQRYSGGAPLSTTGVTWRDGTPGFDRTRNLSELATKPYRWAKVPGNVFRKRGPTYLQSSTFSPYWSVSGEELLRSWEASGGDRPDTLMMLDVGALARLLAVTGPVQSKGLGELTAENLAAKLVGSYDQHQDQAERIRLNDAIFPVFRERFFTGGDFVEKVKALSEAAAARQFAMYSRDPDIEETFRSIGIGGDLSDTDHDYLGIFNQNTNASKTDFFQRRSVRSTVRLAADGSADVHVEVDVLNDATTPYVGPGVDPKSGYFTKWSGVSLASFLPKGVTDVRGTWDGQEWEPYLAMVGDRPFVRRTVLLAPGAQAVMTLDYRAPDAAEVEGENLVYRLDVDPQSLVDAEALHVKVVPPKGFKAADLPDGWRGRRTVTWSTKDLVTSPRWELTFAPGERRG